MLLQSEGIYQKAHRPSLISFREVPRNQLSSPETKIATSPLRAKTSAGQLDRCGRAPQVRQVGIQIGRELMRLPIVTLMALTLSSLMTVVPAYAQSKPQLAVVLDGIDADAKQCGIEENTITSAANLVLRQNGVSVGNLTDPYLYINVNVLPSTTGQCVFSLSVDILASTNQRTVGAFTARSPDLVLCRKGNIARVDRINAPSRAMDIVERLTKVCLGSLSF